MNIRTLVLLLGAVFCLPAFADTDGTLPTLAEKQAAVDAIKQWKGFEGVWEGELRYVAAPKEAWYQQRQPARLVLEKSAIKVFVRVEGSDWQELAMTYRSYQPDELTLVILGYGAQGVWTENNVIVLTRRSEDDAEMYVQRVVNNWAGKAPPGGDLVFGDSRVGKVKRQPGS
jgi:hypothetical protein